MMHHLLYAPHALGVTGFLKSWVEEGKILTEEPCTSEQFLVQTALRAQAGGSGLRMAHDLRHLGRVRGLSQGYGVGSPVPI